MNRGWWTRILIGAAAVAIPTRSLLAQSAPPPSPPAAPLPPLPTDPVPQLAATLADSTASPTQRDEAASQLADRAPYSPAAADALLRGLTGGHDQALAVAHTIADVADPNPQWIAPLAQLLGSERQLHDAAARALSRYGEEPAARDALIAFARNEHQVPMLRAATATALGAFVDKSAAEALVGLLEVPRQATSITRAASEALIAMTGLTDNGNDPVRWRQWITAHAALPDAQWKAQVYPGRDAQLQRIENRQQALVPEIDSILTDHYQSAPDAQKNALVMRYLKSPEPDVRVVGAEIVRTAQQSGLSFPRDEAESRLTALVGDSDPKVRLKAAEALQVLEFGHALDALLQQLSIESHTDVKIALLGAISPLDDPRALPEVRKLLHDPSMDVAIAAADTIRQLGKKLYSTDANQAADVASELWQTIQQRANEPRAAEFKAAAIEAMAPLRDENRASDYMPLLDGSEPEAIRAAALHALRDLGNKQTSDAIARRLTSETSPTLRADAIDALGTTGTFDADAQALYDHTKPANEPDQTVRDKAWLVWGVLLGGSTDVSSLADWAQRMGHDGEWQHRIDVLNVLNATLKAQNKLSDLATFEQDTGDAYNHLNRPDLAAEHFQNALNIWVTQNQFNATTESLVELVINALIQSKQYEKAIAFGQTAISRHSDDAQTIGAAISRAADTMHTNPATRADAAKLIDLALRMQPAVPDLYKGQLIDIQKEIAAKP